ncbi:WD40 repeat-like protein [Linnemannia elongata AG-77]|uniref:WD40 repeat-like protein n=1 Tax=Linnemannia elongata AG-77 TaxID=1314771 RepID=A0A197K7C8_9FUNG|nr:WD40 repeat-like protein [Linnemannia elongata AG-77]
MLFTVALREGSLITYDTTTWTRVRQHKEQIEVLTIAFSPNNQHLALGNIHGSCRLWDTLNGETLLVMEGHTDWVRSVAFSPCGNQIASASDDSTIRLWSSEKGECLFVLNGHEDAVMSAVYSADGRRLVSRSNDGIIRVWDPKTGTPEADWVIPRVNALHVALSTDGSQFALIPGSRSCEIHLVDAITGEMGLILDGYTSRLEHIVFSPIGELIASSSLDDAVRLWNLSSGLLISRLSGHTNRITTCAFSPDGLQIASGDNDGIIRFWEVNNNCLSSTTRKGAANVRTVAYSHDGLSIISYHGNTVQRWESSTGSSKYIPLPSALHVYSIALSPNGHWFASGCNDGNIRLKNVRADVVEFILFGYNDHRVHSIDYSPDGQRLVLGTNTSSILIWDLQSEKPNIKLEGHTNTMYSVAYSPCGKWILSGSRDKTARLWSGEVDSWSCVAVVSGFSEPVTSVAWNPVVPMEFVTGSDDGSVRVWRISSAEAGGISVCMHWGSHIGQLCAVDLIFMGAIGLSPIYRKLLVQRGSFDYLLLSEENEA